MFLLLFIFFFLVVPRRPPGSGAVWARGAPGCSERADARSLQALGALLGFELDLRAFGQRAEAAAVLDFAVVGEQILAAVGGGDEAVALAVVKPLDDAGLLGAPEISLRLSCGAVPPRAAANTQR